MNIVQIRAKAMADQEKAKSLARLKKPEATLKKGDTIPSEAYHLEILGNFYLANGQKKVDGDKISLNYVTRLDANTNKLTKINLGLTKLTNGNYSVENIERQS